MSQVSIEPLVERFAALVRRAAGDSPHAVQVSAAAAQVIRAAYEGHSCVPIEALGDRPMLDALAAHPWVATDDGTTPLVLEHGGLYLRRLRDAEQRVARALRERSDGRLHVITGGPGTGKTTSVRQRLAALEQAEPGLRIALAAPTGKAATRLGQAVGRPAETVHRLLAYLPSEDRFRRGPGDPLEQDVVVVDEASMLPLTMMDALLAALRPDARLILLGDHEQLASVEAGNVLGDVVRAAEGGALRGAVERLTTSHRFDATRGIGALARAIREGDADAAMALLSAGEHGLSLVTGGVRDAAWVERYVSEILPVFAAASANEALSRLEAARVLCATNVGESGSEAVVRRVESELRRRGIAALGSRYRGRPVLISRNDYALELFNGDTGVLWSASDDPTTVREVYVASAGDVRAIPLPQLPEASTAWAMSVHKSQGSEFGRVTVVLPEGDARIVTRELLYTAVTRARERIEIVGSEESVRRAVERRTPRSSGLLHRLAHAE